MPADITLEQNFPNPFNPSTVISFSLPAASNVSIHVFDILGRDVATIVKGYLTAGKHVKEWNASGLPSGVYFYSLQAESFTQTKHMMLIR